MLLFNSIVFILDNNRALYKTNENYGNDYRIISFFIGCT